MPITSTSVQLDYPCLDPSLIPAQKAYGYIAETDRESIGCKMLGKDSRYEKLNLTISEYELQQESGVLETLKGLPSFDLFDS